MAISVPVTTNPLTEGSVLGSNWFNPAFLFNHGAEFFRNVFLYLSVNHAQVVSTYHGILFFVCLFFLTIISYTSIRMFEIRSKERKHLAHEIAEYAHHQAEHEQKVKHNQDISKNEAWVKTLGYLFSQHASDWKLAVMEADLMLETLMNQLGFKGATLGDKLKAASADKFHNLSAAWEAHTVRNRIAHEGTSFELSQREAKRVIALYEQIFREFGFI